MDLFIITGYAAVAIAVFAVFRLPLNRWTVPIASVGGVFFVFALIQVLNYYHPHSAQSALAPATASDRVSAAEEAPQLVAWFRLNQQGRLRDGSTAEITFEGIPGEVFRAEVRGILTPADLGSAIPETAATMKPEGIPVLVAVTDERYRLYRGSQPGGAAQAAVYSEDMQELAVVRQTLLRMTAWMNYLSLPG